MDKKLGYLLLGILLNCMPAVAGKASVSAVSLMKDDWLNRLNAYWGKGQLDSALICTDNLILLDSTDTKGYTLKAAVLNEMYRYEEALEVNTKALNLDSNNSFIIVRQSTILGNLSRYEEALKLLNDALEKSPEDPRLYLEKAQTYASAKDTANAIAVCETLLKLKKIEDGDCFQAHSLIVKCSSASSLDKAVKNMVKDMGASDYRTAAFVTKEYNSRSLYKKGDKYKKIAFELREKNKIEDKTMFIDEYRHSNAIVQVYEYFDPKEARGMSIQYVFRVFDNQTYEWMYNIRVEYVADYFGQYKSQMAVMAKLSQDGFRTYWETFSELKSTPYEKWINYANQIIDDKLKVGSATIFNGKDQGEDKDGGDGASTEEK